jgi:serine/threonine protein kinase
MHMIPDVFDTENIYIGDRYRRLAEIGQGGSGSRVFKVEDSDGRIWALKYLCDVHSDSDPRFKRFMNEIRFAADYQHDNLLRIIDEGKIPGDNGHQYPFYIMPFYPDTLEALIKQGIPHDKVLRYFGQLLDAVEFINECGFIHRDLKPANIFYDPDSNNLIVADFGIADFSSDVDYAKAMTATGKRLASGRYGSPEQIYGKWRPHPIFGGSGRVDHRADIWALGILLNEMFTGIHPFSANGYDSILYDVLHRKWLELDGLESVCESVEDLVDELLLYNDQEKRKGFHLSQWIRQMQQKYGYLDKLFKQMTHRRPYFRPDIRWIREVLRTRGDNLQDD